MKYYYKLTTEKAGKTGDTFSGQTTLLAIIVGNTKFFSTKKIFFEDLIRLFSAKSSIFAKRLGDVAGHSPTPPLNTFRK